jgi:hypothetical protein
MKLAVVTCFYSFASYKRPIANLHRFLRQMQKDGIPVFGVEAHTPLKPVHTRNYPNWKRVAVDSKLQVLWHKEALLNLAEKMVPEEYDAIAWIDADVWFSNSNWRQEAEEALETHDVIQLFEEACWTSEAGVAELRKPGVAKVPLTQDWKSHPGFAWAMRREFWHQIGGLYPFALSGGGDSIMTVAFQQKPLWPHLNNHLGRNHTPFQEWRARLGKPRLGGISGQCWHEWHGTRHDRDYVGRARRTATIVVGQDLILGPNELPMWTDRAAPGLVDDIAKHFIRRNEDGNE